MGGAPAHVHWDIGAEVGVMQRFVTGADPGASPPTPGPVGEVHAHVAVVPMLRAGLYVAHDVSPLPGAPAREMTEAGMRAKLTPPLLAAPWRSWAFLGLGYARTYEPSHPESSGGAQGGSALVVAGAGGGLLELPFGVGIGYRLRPPWELFGELAGRVTLNATGAMYRRQGLPPGDLFQGKDSFALSLSVGVSFDQ